MSKVEHTGWKLVPVEPTPAMMSAAFAAFEIDNPKQYGDGSEARLAIYRAMLDAAPEAPAPSHEALVEALREARVWIAPVGVPSRVLSLIDAALSAATQKQE